MHENVITTSLMEPDDFIEEDNREVMIKVDHVSMVFNMASQQLNNLKEYAIALFRRELMFKEFRALNDISLEVRKGDVYGIMGTNGSGKSTLLKIIAGVLEPTEGSVEIRGNIAPLIELGAGFDYDLTARENIYLNGALLGYPKQFIQQHFDDIVDFAEIREFLDMPIKNYSSGMVARIAFAIATVIVPDILIVDEVLSVGDYMFQQKCERRIRTLINEYNTTVLIVSHSNDQIERLCNKAIWIEKSWTRIKGSAKRVCDTYRALGGHSGSPLSEKMIFAILNNGVKVDPTFTTSIAGEDTFSTCTKIYNRCEFAEGELNTIILAHGNHFGTQSVIPGFAGALKAMPLLTMEEYVPDAVLATIRESKAERVILLNQDNELSDDVELAVRENCPLVTELVNMKATDLADLSSQALSYSKSHGASINKVGIIAIGDHHEYLATASPILYRESVPLLYCSDDPEDLRALIASMDESGFEKAFFLHFDTPFVNEYEKVVAEAPIAVTDISTTWPHQFSSMLAEATEDEAAEPKDSYALVVGSNFGLSDVFVASPLSSRLNAEVILADKNNMDSMASARNTIKDFAHPVDSVVFLGDYRCFDEISKEIIARVATMKREEYRNPDVYVVWDSKQAQELWKTLNPAPEGSSNDITLDESVGMRTGIYNKKGEKIGVPIQDSEEA